jgi:hypothetical protein
MEMQKNLSKKIENPVKFENAVGGGCMFAHAIKGGEYSRYFYNRHRNKKMLAHQKSLYVIASSYPCNILIEKIKLINFIISVWGQLTGGPPSGH